MNSGLFLEVRGKNIDGYRAYLLAELPNFHRETRIIFDENLEIQVLAISPPRILVRWKSTQIMVDGSILPALPTFIEATTQNLNDFNGFVRNINELFFRVIILTTQYVHSNHNIHVITRRD